jgi:hypothetical protein
MLKMIVQASAALRVFSSSLSSADITEALATQPDSFYMKGDRIGKKESSTNVRSVSMWCIEEKIILTSGDDGSMLLERCIEQLVRRMQQFQDQLNKLSDCEKDISCGLFSNNEQVNTYLGRNMLRKLAHIEVDLVLNGYLTTQVSEFKLTN